MRSTASRTSISASVSPTKTRVTSTLSRFFPGARHRPPRMRPSPGRRLRRRTPLLERRVNPRTRTPRRRQPRHPSSPARPTRRRLARPGPTPRRARRPRRDLLRESKRFHARRSRSRSGAPARLRSPPSPRAGSERCFVLRTVARVASARPGRTPKKHAGEEKTPARRSPRALTRPRTPRASAYRVGARAVPRRGPTTVRGTRRLACASRFSQRLRLRSPEA